MLVKKAATNKTDNKKERKKERKKKASDYLKICYQFLKTTLNYLRLVFYFKLEIFSTSTSLIFTYD